MFFIAMSHLCASLEFDMPCSWHRNYNDAKVSTFSIKVNPESDLHSCCVSGGRNKDMVTLDFKDRTTICVDMFLKGSTFVEVSYDSPQTDHTYSGYVSNAPPSCCVGGFSVVTPTRQPVAPPIYSLLNSRESKIFCEYCVDETSFSAKMRLCEYNDGCFFFIRVKCIYEDKNNIIVSWGEESPCGTIKDKNVGCCIFSFNTCAYSNSHFLPKIEQSPTRSLKRRRYSAPDALAIVEQSPTTSPKRRREDVAHASPLHTPA